MESVKRNARSSHCGHGGGGRGGGVTSIIKVYTDVRLEWGILFRPPNI